MCPAERHEPIAIPPARPAPGPSALHRATECSWIRSLPRPASPALANKSVPHGCNRAAVSLAPSESVPRGTRAVSPPRAVRWALQRPAHPTFTPSRATSDPAQRVSACQERPSNLPASRAFAPRSAKRPPPRHSVRPGTDPDPGPRLRHWGLRHWPTRRYHLFDSAPIGPVAVSCSTRTSGVWLRQACTDEAVSLASIQEDSLQSAMHCSWNNWTKRDTLDVPEG